MTTTWDPSNRSAGMSLSGGNLTLTTDGLGQRSVLATTAYSGKKYWEIGTFEFNALTTREYEIGISQVPSSFDHLFNFGFPGWAGVGVDCVISASNTTDWHLYDTSNGSGNPSGSSSGLTAGVAYDTPNNLFYFSINGVWVIGDPSAGTGGYTPTTATTYWPAVTIVTSTTQASLTANFGATAFAFSIPTGYTGFDSSAAPPDVAWEQQGLLLVPRQNPRAVGGSPT